MLGMGLFGGLALFLYGLADRLHKSLEEIHALPLDELAGWAAYFKIRNQDDKI